MVTETDDVATNFNFEKSTGNEKPQPSSPLISRLNLASRGERIKTRSSGIGKTQCVQHQETFRGAS
jgi:hypothetical protein